MAADAAREKEPFVFMTNRFILRAYCYVQMKSRGASANFAAAYLYQKIRAHSSGTAAKGW